MKTHYEVLEVAETASTDVIHAAWRTLMKRYHSDVLATGDSEIARLVNHAHDVLENPLTRRAYDLELAQQRQSERRSPGEFPGYPPGHPWGAARRQTANGYPQPYQGGYPSSIVEMAQCAAFAGANSFIQEFMRQNPHLETIIIHFTNHGGRRS